MTDDDGATPRAPLGSLGAAPAIGRKVSESLGYTDEQAAEWIETKLDGRTPSNVDAYLLRCLDNHVADAAKAKVARDSAKKATAKQAPAKAGGQKSKKTSSKPAGKFTCTNEGCGREFSSKRGLATHEDHHRTAQCLDCKATVKARDLYYHRAAHRRQVQQPQPQPQRPKFSMSDWQTERHLGLTDKPLNDWLIEKARTADRSPQPQPQQPKPKRDPKPCQGCNRPLTGWEAVQTPSYCANCRASRRATFGTTP